MYCGVCLKSFFLSICFISKLPVSMIFSSSWSIFDRVPTAQGKQENGEKEFQTGKKAEFENWKRKIQYQENDCRKNYCMTSMKWRLKFTMLWFCYGNSQGKLKLHCENTGKTQGIFSKLSGNHVYIHVNLNISIDQLKKYLLHHYMQGQSFFLKRIPHNI